MSYISQSYVQQAQAASILQNASIVLSQPPFDPTQAPPHYYYPQQQLYIPPASSQVANVVGVSSLGTSGTDYFQAQQATVNSINAVYSYSDGTQLPGYVASEWQQYQNQVQAYQTEQYQQYSQPPPPPGDAQAHSQFKQAQTEAQQCPAATYQPLQSQAASFQPQSQAATFQSQQSETATYQPLQSQAAPFQPQQSQAASFQPQVSTYQPQQSEATTYQTQQPASATFQPQQTASATFQPQQSESATFQPQQSAYQPQQSQAATFQPQQVTYETSQQSQYYQTPQNRQQDDHAEQNQASVEQFKPYQSQHNQQNQSQQNTYRPQHQQQDQQPQQSRQSTFQHNQQDRSQQNRQSPFRHNQQDRSQQNRQSPIQHNQQNRQSTFQHNQQERSQKNRQPPFQRNQEDRSQQNRQSPFQRNQPDRSQQSRQPPFQHNQEDRSQQNRQRSQQDQSEQNRPPSFKDKQQEQPQESIESSSHSSEQGQSQPAKSLTEPNEEDKPVMKRCSPLNDFGDMGAAVQKYAETDPKKSKVTSLNPENIQNQEENRKLDENKYRQEHGLVVWDDKGKVPVPDPFEHFEDIPGLKEVQINAFYQAGFQAPTPIQAQTWPIALKDRDLVSIAKTGSGKTLAFLMPAYQKMDARGCSRNRTINVLVLAPTRELATQIQEEADKFGSVAGYRSVCAYGGAPKRNQLEAINSGVSVVVATPGRLNDFIDSRQINLSSVFYLVMDEADRMLDMGFEPQIRSILRRVPRQRQTLMFSATWPEEVRRLANDFLVNPIHIRLGDQDSLQANENIKQFLVLLQSGEDKDREILSLLKSKITKPGDTVLVFVARKNTCNFVANMLNRLGVNCAAMHGDRTQEFREETLAAFKDGKLPVLVATDVASRGLDVKGLIAVVNYDLPGSTEDYVHRIGRTGRAGLTGESYTFLSHSHEDIWKALSIVEVMEKTGQPVPQDIQMLINDLKEKQQRSNERRAAEDQQFSKVLIVAEKPSVAKMIADNLSNNGRYRTRKGKSRANQIFEFIKFFKPAQQKCKIMVTSVVGHIFGLSFENQKAHDIATLFDAPVQKVIEETSKKLCIVEHLQELGNESEYLYLWLDCDREGENIGFEVISLVAGSIHYDNVYRARFSSLTSSELNYAYDNPIRPDKYSAMSVDARQELDLKIGVAFTRLMTRTYIDMAREKFRLRDQKCISYGPCQTPTLWFCVQRHREIQNFQRKKYFVCSIELSIQGQQCKFDYVNDKVEDMDELKKVESAVEGVENATVTEVKEERKTFARPVGLNTVTLLKACSKGLGMSPTSAMSAAEHLYTSGYISYPRTETTKYDPSFDLISVLEEQANSPNWGRVATYLLRSGCVNPPAKGHDAGDHPPITPMRAATRDEITKSNEWRIYDYVTRHFIASLHNDFTYVERKVIVNIGGCDFNFTSHEVLDRGFAFAMPWKENNLHLNEVQLPGQGTLKGQSFGISGLNKEENYTKPPDYLQESELISLMDKHGIGTDASIPTHIKNVQERHYVDVCGPGEDGQKGTIIPVKKFFGKNNRGRGGPPAPRPTSRHMVPRGFGMAFLSCFENLDNELCEPQIRSYMEKQITKIATGETEKSDVVSSNLKLFLNKFIVFRDNLQRCDRYFAPKVYPNEGGNFDQGGFNNNNNDRGRGRGRGGMGRGFHEGRGGRGGGRGFHNGGRGSGGRGGGGDRGGRGGFNNEGRGGGRGGFNSEDRGRGRGLPNPRGKHGNGNQPFGNADFKRQKTWE